ncbi:MAG TPA: DUF559 domain-containing protein [Brevundimonas sp.]|jgi:very-short-patch-repair endonuclease|uniref:endonuclease domain-containing protein n=1 Tax=Brevundimonas sp. TaxID=1871086 RepID=UPI002DF112D0|nr:DUF559 domain-containing protein [Brevundimonas sp.]
MSLLLLAIIGVAIFILWHFLPQQAKRSPQPAPRYRKDVRINAQQSDWQTIVEEHCESPAETAFLRAMIAAHGMTPDSGSLVAAGIRLDFQVEEGRYRVDFLINKWLVVEVDGAAYHSSPEAKSRDQMRDGYFEGLGYTVLRLPAKLVFHAPEEAVKAVQSALAVGRREVAPLPKKSDGFTRLAQTAAAFGQAVELADKKHAVRKALATAELVVSSERSALDAAMELARQRSQHSSWLADLPEEDLAQYEQSVADLRAAVRDDDSASFSESAVWEPTELHPFETPSRTGDGWIDDQIADGLRLLTARRSANFQSVRRKLAADASIRPHMRQALADLGREELWARLN